MLNSFNPSTTNKPSLVEIETVSNTTANQNFTWAPSLLRLVITACVVGMGALVRISPLGLVGFGLLGITSVLVQGKGARNGRVLAGGLIVAGAGTILAAVGLWSVRENLLVDNYYAFMAGLMSATILPLRREVVVGRLRTCWAGLGLAWAFAGGSMLMAEAYARNRPMEFYLSVGVIVFLLIVVRRSFRLPALVIMVVHTIILLLVGIPALDLLFRSIPHSPKAKPVPTEELYLYRNAAKDPARFGQWCKAVDDQFHKMIKEAFTPDPSGKFPPRPKPNARTRFFDSEISINSLGFRGREIPREKGDAYRIVTLGESTTFGVTMRTNDAPWPEVLEQLICDRLQPHRPVEVINAGISSWELKGNLRRLEEDILPLHPDMIISYHGYNGFGMISGVVPLSNRYVVPVYRPRPVKLLADCEFRVRVLLAVRAEQALLASHAPASVAPLNTEYAKAYEDLIEIAHTNNIQLAIADYCMAVNEHSPQAVLDFYRTRYPSVAWRIRNNQIHTTIVRELARQHPEIRFVETQPGLDGEYDKFIDLMHFTQPGRQQLAESVFSGLQDLLRTNLVDSAARKDTRVESKP